MGEMMHFPDTVEEFMELFKVIDSDHVYSNGIEFVPIFRMQQWFDHLKAKPKTEGDKIRAMSDEELADFICHNVSNGTVNCAFCAAEEFCRIGHIGWLEWLKQEVTNDRA